MWTPIKYMGFWDVPRIFIVQYQGQTLLFDSPFDEALDDYPDVYKVFLMPLLDDEALPEDWTTLRERATRYFGEVPIARIHFNATNEYSINTAVIDELFARKAG